MEIFKTVKEDVLIISNDTNIGLANMSIEKILMLPIKQDHVNYLITYYIR